MTQSLKAIYRNGTFVLQTPIDLAEETEVELVVQASQLIAPPITDIATKQKRLKALVARIQQNPIPLDAPRFTRETLHERC